MTKENSIFYCYSIRLYHFISSFNEKCIASKVNSNSGTRYWMFNKSEKLDSIIELYNELKHKFN